MANILIFRLLMQREEGDVVLNHRSVLQMRSRGSSRRKSLTDVVNVVTGSLGIANGLGGNTDVEKGKGNDCATPMM